MVSKFRDSLYGLIGTDGTHLSSPDAPSILLAVSGGIDSMCMAHLFSSIFYSNMAIATVNFSLRGEESDGDEELVKNWAGQKGIRCFSNTFDTHAYASDKGISTQMAARDLRYNWFEELTKEHGFDYVAVAHNLNDSVETFFLNILRGTGLQGMTGIRKRNGNIIRPLLSITRREIAEYVKLHNIPFREDSSNSQSHYSRNRLRNMVFPEFEMINQSYLTTVERDMANVQAALEILEDILPLKRDFLFDESGRRISIKKLLDEKRADYWLYSLLSDYGFNYDQVLQILASLNGQPGKEFHSGSHLLIKDREWLLIYRKGAELNESSDDTTTIQLQDHGQQNDTETARDKELLIENLQTGQSMEVWSAGGRLEFFRFSKPHGFKHKRRVENSMVGDLFSVATSSGLSQTPEPELYVDAGKLLFPLKVRRWQQGDKFVPLGMKGFKKISDFLTDIKLDKVSKTNIPVVVSGDKIVALPGYRIDDRFKVDNYTIEVVRIHSK